MGLISESDVVLAVKSVLKRYLHEDKGLTPLKINSGLCVDFAEDVMRYLGLEVEGKGFYMWDIDSFRDYDTEQWEREAVEIDLNTKPPFGLTWDNLDKIPFGHHRWITYNKKHYDAEGCEGVANLFELPFFKRYIENYKKIAR